MQEIAFPIELYVLCIIAQEEVYRDYIYFAPEIRGSKQWNSVVASDNRKTVLSLFEQSIHRCIDIEDRAIIT